MLTSKHLCESTVPSYFLSKAKINYLNVQGCLVIRIKHNVVRLDVSVGDVVIVEVFKELEQLMRDVPDVGLGHGTQVVLPPLRNIIHQATTSDQFRHYKVKLIIIKQLSDLNHV